MIAERHARRKLGKCIRCSIGYNNKAISRFATGTGPLDETYHHDDIRKQVKEQTIKKETHI